LDLAKPEMEASRRPVKAFGAKASSGKVETGFPKRSCFTKKIERPTDSI
jgi:hypothetical protein